MALTIFIFSTIIGSLFALVEHRRTPLLRECVVAYKIVFKGIPMVVVIFLVYYSLPAVIHFLGSLVGAEINGHATPNWLILVVSLIACVAAFQAEVVKGALNSFDTGQADAARSLGYKNSQLFRRILVIAHLGNRWRFRARPSV